VFIFGSNWSFSASKKVLGKEHFNATDLNQNQEGNKYTINTQRITRLYQILA
jgi:hypothetical protein